jgi:aspartate racemase
MKRIGIVGGLGPEATIYYYKEIINAFKDENGSLNYPEIIIYSVNMSVFIGLMTEKKYDMAVELLLDKINSLKAAGAEFAVLSANTPHMLFELIKKSSTLPLISIVEATRDECLRLGLRKPGLFGTGFTMNGTFYQEVFSHMDLPVILPDEVDKEKINYKLFSEIELGIFKDETRQMLVKTIDKMVKNKQIDSLILGCTEFPLILNQPEYAGIPMLNTTKIHVDAIVRYCKTS